MITALLVDQEQALTGHWLATDCAVNCFAGWLKAELSFALLGGWELSCQLPC